MSAFFCRKLGFFPKKYPYSKQQCESCGRDFLVLFSVFVRQKVTVNGNINFANSLSRIWLLGLLQIGQNSEKWQCCHNFLICHRQSFLTFFVSLVKFSYWSKFHVSIITGSGIMTVFFYKGLTRNPEIRNIPVWVLPNMKRLVWVTIPR